MEVAAEVTGCEACLEPTSRARFLFGAKETFRLLRTGWRGLRAKAGTVNRRQRGGQKEFATAAYGAIRARGLLSSKACIPQEGREGHRLSCLRPAVRNLTKTRSGWNKAALK